MISKKLWISGLLFGLPLSWAAEEPCVQEPLTAAPQETGTLSELARNIRGRSWVDGYFMLQSTSRGSSADMDIQATHLSSLPFWTVSKVYSLVRGAFGERTLGPIPPPQSFAQQLTWLKDRSAGLSSEERKLMLSLIGSRLSEGYDTESKKNRSSAEELFQNAVARGTQGGVCGDIHDYLRQVAGALGFQDARVMSGVWQKDPKSPKSEGHYILLFKDPQSGEYFAQNYSQLVATGQKRMEGALNNSLKILAPFAGPMMVGSSENNGRYRIFVPQTARWVQQEIAGSADFKPDQSFVNLKIGNQSQRISVEAAGKLGSGQQVKVFGLHSEYRSDGEGIYRIDAVGVSGKAETTIQDWRGVVDEVGLSATARVGAIAVDMPMLAGTYDGGVARVQGQSKGMFGGIELKGRARINDTTGRLEFTVNQDFLRNGTSGSTPIARITAGVDQKLPNAPVTVSLERVLEFSGRNVRKYPEITLQTAHDKVSVLYDSRDPEQPGAYLVVGSEVYAFDGVQKTTAIGLREYLKQVIPTQRHGEFSVVADLSKVIRSKDTYFETPLTKTLGASWNKKLENGVTVGADLQYSNRTPSQLFSGPGTVLPVFSEKRDARGSIWLHRSF